MVAVTVFQGVVVVEKNPTIQCIAERANLSPMTVSRVLSGKGPVATETQNKVLQIATDLGYRPNYLARGLAGGKTGIIGFLLNTYPSEVALAKVVALDDVVTRSGYRLLLGNTTYRPESIYESAQELIARGVDGLIIHEDGRNLQQVKRLMELSIPKVFLDWQLPMDCLQVVQDRGKGIEQAVDHFFSLGHRQIYLLVHPKLASRVEPFLQALAGRGIKGGLERLMAVDVKEALTDDGHLWFDVDLFKMHTKLALSEHPDCTAILCSNDTMAMATVSTLAEMGFRVPQDISVIGFDNSAWTASYYPRLTTVAQPTRAIVQAGLDLLMKFCDSGCPVGETVMIPSQLVVRDSTGPVRNHPLSVSNPVLPKRKKLV